MTAGLAAFIGERGRVAVAVADDDDVWEEAKVLLRERI
jgi:hypothetical protein